MTAPRRPRVGGARASASAPAPPRSCRRGRRSAGRACRAPGRRRASAAASSSLPALNRAHASASWPYTSCADRQLGARQSHGVGEAAIVVSGKDHQLAVVDGAGRLRHGTDALDQGVLLLRGAAWSPLEGVQVTERRDHLWLREPLGRPLEQRDRLVAASLGLAHPRQADRGGHVVRQIVEGAAGRRRLRPTSRRGPDTAPRAGSDRRHSSPRAPRRPWRRRQRSHQADRRGRVALDEGECDEPAPRRGARGHLAIEGQVAVPRHLEVARSRVCASPRRCQRLELFGASAQDAPEPSARAPTKSCRAKRMAGVQLASLEDTGVASSARPTRSEGSIVVGQVPGQPGSPDIRGAEVASRRM